MVLECINRFLKVIGLEVSMEPMPGGDQHNLHNVDITRCINCNCAFVVVSAGLTCFLARIQRPGPADKTSKSSVLVDNRKRYDWSFPYEHHQYG